MPEQALAPSSSHPRTPTTVKDLLGTTNYQSRLREILGERAPQFAASIVQLSQGSPQLKSCDPHSLIASAITAAVLDLPIDKNLGFAHIVPYAQYAQFQMGYKGLIQLAQRSGQYKKMNASPINQEAFGGFDEVGDPVINWDKVDETKEPVGYAFAFQTIGGFTKTVYWTKAKVEAHATRYSAAFKAKKKDSPWFTNFRAMALKTVIKDGISHWGIMSVQIQKALVEDQGIHRNLNSDVEYVDNQETTNRPVHTLVEVESVVENQPQSETEKPEAAATAAKEDPNTKGTEAPAPDGSSPSPAGDQPKNEADKLIDDINAKMKVAGVVEHQLVMFSRKNKLCPSRAVSMGEFTETNLKKIIQHWDSFVDNVKQYPTK